MKFSMKKFNKMSDIVREPNFINENGITIRSVSLVIYKEDDGFLLCDEERKGKNPDDKTLNSHLIGGKVEQTDSDPLYTGIREFCEETGFILNGFNKEETILKVKDLFIQCPRIRNDYVVSEQKSLCNRFIVINIDNLDDEIKDELLSFIENWKKRNNLPLNSIYFWNPTNPLNQTPSSLLKFFIENLPSKSRLRF